jgi:hypothetical protein
MSEESPRRAARERVATYHESQLSQLIERVDKAVDRFRAGELDAFETDEVMLRYSRAAKELWKFCNLSDVEFTAHSIARTCRSTGGNKRLHAGDEPHGI